MLYKGLDWTVYLVGLLCKTSVEAAREGKPEDFTHYSNLIGEIK